MKNIHPRKVAIFDIDGTIFRSSLLTELVEALLQEKILPARMKRSYENAYREWLDRKGAYQTYVDALVRAYLKYVKGVRYADFEPVARRVVAFHKNRVYRYTRDLLRDLKKKRYYLLAISHSPKDMVHEFARAQGFDRFYGTVYEVDFKGLFTGKALHLDFIYDKARVLAHVVAEHGLTLKGSVGVGDTESDIPFLKMVDHPICFNPNTGLYAHAKRHGWKVVVERKDVVYTLK